MKKFIIVDDNDHDINHIKTLINDVVNEEKEIKTYNKLNIDLKQEIKNTDTRKVYILDIVLDKASGIEIAKLIRTVDYESEIIFVTNHDSMFESVHRSVYAVFDFIEKFHDFDRRFKRTLTEILKRNSDDKMFIYKKNNIDISLYYKSILYIYRETEERKLVIVTDNHDYKVGISLKEIVNFLDKRFEQTHRSCIVNKERIQEKNYNKGYFRLDNGNKVYMLSKKFKENDCDTFVIS